MGNQVESREALWQLWTYDSDMGDSWDFMKHMKE